MGISNGHAPSRRGFLLGGAAATAAAAILPGGAGKAQVRPRWRRYNVASPQGQAMLASYAIAVEKLLALEPTDPRNWYRIAFTHFLDCPHGNWWLYPWHRGITGWVEQIVRQFSGNPNFAFPYWDWTANPQVPAGMAQGVLNPTNAAFIKNYKTFKTAFQPALAKTDYFTKGSARQQQLAYRGLGTSDLLWAQLDDPSTTAFFPTAGMPNVRNPSPQLDCVTQRAVSAATIAAGLQPTVYVPQTLPTQPISVKSFSSPKAAHHSDMVGFAVLEGQPHNNIHNNTGGVVHPTVGGVCQTGSTNTGGFMQDFLSPVDPLFFLHHSNLDRLWTVWTDRQLAAGRPATPTGADGAAWAAEPFLFFCNAAGQPLTAKAGDYATIGAFAYDYQPGSVGATLRPLLNAGRGRGRGIRIVGRPAGGVALAAGAAADTIPVGPDLRALAAPGRADGSIITVTVIVPHGTDARSIPVSITAPDGSAIEVGRITLFGRGMMHGPLAFALPFGPALSTLSARGALRGAGTLRVVAAIPAPRGPGLTATAATELPVQAVVIEGD